MATAMAHKAKDQHWQIDKSLTECLAHMLKNDFEFNDVIFQFNSTRGKKSEKPVTIRALQLLLLARSPVFYSMFTGDLAKGNNPKIEIPDIEPHVFKELLRFIYTDQVHLTAENVTGVLYASKKYMVTNLTKKCVKFLGELLSADTAAQLLDQTILFEEHELKERVMKKIKSEASAVLSSDDFTEISQQALREILQLNLKINKEIEVFEAAMKWAEKKCKELNQRTDGTNRRKVLGDCIKLIRFPTMSLDEFNEFVAPTEVLTEGEGYQMMRYLASKTKKPALNLPFSTEPRSDTTIHQLIIPGPHEWGGYGGLVCQFSRPVILKKLLVHAIPFCYSVFLSLSQNGRHLLGWCSCWDKKSYSEQLEDTHPTAPGLAYIVVPADDIRIDAGAVELATRMELVMNRPESEYPRLPCSPSSVSRLSDNHLTITFSSSHGNPLLGIEYSLAA